MSNCFSRYIHGKLLTDGVDNQGNPTKKDVKGFTLIGATDDLSENTWKTISRLTFAGQATGKFEPCFSLSTTLEDGTRLLAHTFEAKVIEQSRPPFPLRHCIVLNKSPHSINILHLAQQLVQLEPDINRQYTVFEQLDPVCLEGVYTNSTNHVVWRESQFNAQILWLLDALFISPQVVVVMKNDDPFFRLSIIQAIYALLPLSLEQTISFLSNALGDLVDSKANLKFKNPGPFSSKDHLRLEWDQFKPTAPLKTSFATYLYELLEQGFALAQIAVLIQQIPDEVKTFEAQTADTLKNRLEHQILIYKLSEENNISFNNLEQLISCTLDYVQDKPTSLIIPLLNMDFSPELLDKIGRQYPITNKLIKTILNHTPLISMETWDSQLSQEIKSSEIIIKFGLLSLKLGLYEFITVGYLKLVYQSHQQTLFYNQINPQVNNITAQLSLNALGALTGFYLATRQEVRPGLIPQDLRNSIKGFKPYFDGLVNLIDLAATPATCYDNFFKQLQLSLNNQIELYYHLLTRATVIDGRKHLLNKLAMTLVGQDLSDKQKWLTWADKLWEWSQPIQHKDSSFIKNLLKLYFKPFMPHKEKNALNVVTQKNIPLDLLSEVLEKLIKEQQYSIDDQVNLWFGLFDTQVSPPKLKTDLLTRLSHEPIITYLSMEQLKRLITSSPSHKYTFIKRIIILNIYNLEGLANIIWEYGNQNPNDIVNLLADCWQPKSSDEVKIIYYALQNKEGRSGINLSTKLLDYVLSNKIKSHPHVRLQFFYDAQDKLYQLVNQTYLSLAQLNQQNSNKEELGSDIAKNNADELLLIYSSKIPLYPELEWFLYPKGKLDEVWGTIKSLFGRNSLRQSIDNTKQIQEVESNIRELRNEINYLEYLITKLNEGSITLNLMQKQHAQVLRDNFSTTSGIYKKLSRLLG